MSSVRLSAIFKAIYSVLWYTEIAPTLKPLIKHCPVTYARPDMNTDIGGSAVGRKYDIRRIRLTTMARTRARARTGQWANNSHEISGFNLPAHFDTRRFTILGNRTDNGSCLNTSRFPAAKKGLEKCDSFVLSF